MLDKRVNLRNLKTGTFTIVYPTHNTHRTIKVEDGDGGFAGKKILGIMIGTDNETHFFKFGHVNPDGTIRFWAVRTGDWDDTKKERVARAFAKIAEDEQTAFEAGVAYAKESGNCFRCNRKLTNPESIASGIGPECAKKF